MITGAREIGKAYEIHPYDLGAFLNTEDDKNGVYVDIVKNPPQGFLTINGDIYFQSCDKPPVTESIR